MIFIFRLRYQITQIKDIQVHFIILKLMSSSKNSRIRRSLISIEYTDERKSFFYCLKLLGVLPPPQGSDFGSWKFTTKAKTSNYRPKCLHDVLIGSHATSCEHNSNYFAYYHRHLMIICEIFLNYGHRILKGGFTALGEAYPPSNAFSNIEPFKQIQGFKFHTSTEYDFLYQGNNISYWTQVFKVYHGLVLPEQVSCHYWAPTNYLQDADLSIPVELAAKQTSDPIDVLFYGINKSYPWEINTERRWFNTPDQYSKDKVFSSIPKVPQAYTEEEQKLLNGQLDPRQHPNSYKESNGGNPPKPALIGNYLTKNKEMVSYRIYNTYDDSKKNYRLNAIQSRESIANYGAASKNLQYITLQEKSKLTAEGHGGDWIETFNWQTPHYQYAYPLFHSMKAFIQGTDSKGIQRSHNTLHNNFQTILNDSSYSLTSFLFYAYHSWIDAMLQIKLRVDNKTDLENPNQKPAFDYFTVLLNQKYVKDNVRGKFVSKFNQINANSTNMSEWFLSGDDAIAPSTGGRYPIFEWYDTATDNMSFSFCSRDYILTRNNIRDSQHLNEIYQSPGYVDLFRSRYAFFKNLDKFNYNYNYQIGTKPSDKDNLLNPHATNMPQYLLNMYKDVTGQDLPKQKAIQSAVRTKQLKFNIPADLVDQIRLEVRKLFESNIEIFASYAPDIENGSNPVYVKLKNIFKHIAKTLNDHQLDELERYTHHGVQANDIYIFGKEQQAKNCPRCKDLKGRFVSLDDDLRVRIPGIWKYLHIASLNKVLYDSSNPNKEPVSIYDKLFLVPNPRFEDYRFISGAEEIFVNVKSQILSKEAKFIRLDTESYSVRTDTVKIVSSRKHLSFLTNFDFYKLFDVDNENGRSYFDRYVYKQLRGWVSIGNKRTKFQFNIPSFQRILRLTLNISLRQDEINVQIEDTDYETKLAFYESYQP